MLSNSRKFISTKKWYTLAVLVGMGLTMSLSAEANTVSVTFLGTDTGVNNGTDYVLPYQLSIDGITTDATCYDIFDDVNPGQTWIANVWTTPEAILEGQFSGEPNAAAGYDEIAFLSQQATTRPRTRSICRRISGTFRRESVSRYRGHAKLPGSAEHAAYTNFNFSSVEFLEDADQDDGRAQAFVVSASAPGLRLLRPYSRAGYNDASGGGLLLLSVSAFRTRKVRHSLASDSVAGLRRFPSGYNTN